jgi:hypothetical protein
VGRKKEERGAGDGEGGAQRRVTIRRTCLPFHFFFLFCPLFFSPSPFLSVLPESLPFFFERGKKDLPKAKRWTVIHFEVKTHEKRERVKKGNIWRFK